MLTIHHTGYLVKKLDKAVDRFLALGYETERASFYDESRKAYFVFLVKDQCRVELVCPDRTSDLYPLLKKYGIGPYHICYETDDLDLAASQLQEQGYTLFKEKQPAKAVGDSAEVIFLYNSDIGIVELVRQY